MDFDKIQVEFRSNPQSASKTYPQLLNDYFKSKDANAAHHEQMTRSFVGDIASALKAYGQIRGLKLPDQNVTDLSLRGLTTTSALSKLSKPERDRVQNVLSVELSAYDLKEVKNPIRQKSWLLIKKVNIKNLSKIIYGFLYSCNFTPVHQKITEVFY
ncbi:hypothetical protein RQM65_08770 [Pricia sp. S334]|uniref:Uncharacterized protein n=1 Tax=Pricia mediterranea TaxID=3076079 RepID=A0ABU3L596_9FLAO|nr:hypothetical protein [Pricia sp. S334]MDT7828753.1 hypothetical protein [Pricia sp. S334]